MVTQLVRGQASIINRVSFLLFQNLFQSFVFISFLWPSIGNDEEEGETLSIHIEEFFTGPVGKSQVKWTGWRYVDEHLRRLNMTICPEKTYLL